MSVLKLFRAFEIYHFRSMPTIYKVRKPRNIEHLKSTEISHPELDQSFLGECPIGVDFTSLELCGRGRGGEESMKLLRRVSSSAME